MTDVVADAKLITVAVPAQEISLSIQPESIAVRIPETALVETERKEIISVQEQNSGFQVIAVGQQGPAGRDGSGGSTETYVAGQTLSGHRAVVTDANGLAIYADNQTAAHANMATKLTLGAALQGDTVQVQLIGRITEPSWNWVVGGTIYVGANGTLTQTPPVSPAVFSKPIAVAETATRVLLIQEPPIML